MKWFQFDSDTPDDLKIRALMLQGGGALAFGHWGLLLCHVAKKGKGGPGEGVRSDGSPLDLDEMAIACGFDDADSLRPFLDRIAKLKLSDRERWERDGVVFLPAMAKRADEYSKKKARRLADRPDDNPVSSGDNPEQPGRMSGHATESPVMSVLSVEDQGSLPIEGKDQVDALVVIWNTKAAAGLPRVARVTDERRRAWRAALAKHPNLADWERAIVFLNGSSWWMGTGPKGKGHDNWKGDLEYLAKPGKLQAALEKADAAGKGSDGAGTGTGTGPADEAARRGRVAPVPGKYAAMLAEDDDHD